MEINSNLHSQRDSRASDAEARRALEELVVVVEAQVAVDEVECSRAQVTHHR